MKKSAQVQRAAAAYKRLLGLLPRRFRDEAGTSMREVFAESYREALGAGLQARAGVWAASLWDLLLTAWEVRRSQGRNKGGMMQSMPQDLRYALRVLAKSPGFSLVAVLTLALGIGANTTIFTLANALFLENPPLVHEPQRLVRLVRTRGGKLAGSFSYPDVLYYREHNTVFEDLTAFDGEGLDLTVRIGRELQPARGWFVCDNFFDLLGVRPARGRWFAPEENSTPATRKVAVISHGFWRRALGGDGQAVGRELRLNGHVFTIVGVAPAEFRGISPLQGVPDVWVPIMSQPLLAPTDLPYPIERVPHHSWSWLTTIARLKPGVTVEAAQANLDAMAGYLAEHFAPWNKDTGAVLTPQFRYHPNGQATLGNLSKLLSAAAAAVLLIACANIAILMLARGSSRARDAGLRLALGCGRGRVMRHALLESLLLALAGGVLGIVAAFWTAELAAALLPFPPQGPVRPDAWVIAFAFGLALTAAVIAGVSPALQTSRHDVVSVLRGDDRSPGGTRLRSAFVVGQLALSLMLVCGAALFVRSLLAARSIDLGFESQGRLVLPVNLRNQGYRSEQGRLFIRQALERLRALPGVRSASATHMVPFRGMWTSGLPPSSSDPSDPPPEVGTNAVASDYFAAMGIPILRGRPLLDSDDSLAPPAAVVNQALAEAYWPGEDALGKTIGPPDDPEELYTVVGVAANATYYELGEAPQAQAYLSIQQLYQPSLHFLLRSDRPVQEMAQAARQALLQVDATLPIGNAFSLQTVFEGETARYRMMAALVSVFGMLALLLAAVGLYGVESFAVARRRREIGIRMALGAGRARVQRTVVGRALFQTALGVVLGLAGTLAASSWVESLLFGVRPRDPLTLIAVPLLLAAVATLAGAIPARRASRIDPIEALRAE